MEWLAPQTRPKPSPSKTSAARARRVFCNRSLRLENIEWVGFDMDYTLAVYDQAELDRLTIDAALVKLIARGYPESLRTVDYDLSFPVRGLTVDAQLGNVLKMDRHKYVKRAYHGMRELSYDERREHYRATRIRAQGSTRYYFVDSLYALSEVTLFASGIAHMEAAGHAVDYHRWFYDIRETVDLSHQDSTIVSAIVADPARYVRRAPTLKPTLEALRTAGKKLFLLTNSRPAYTQQIMRFLLEDEHSQDFSCWQELFELVVTSAKKPSFFVDQGISFRDQLERPCEHLTRGQIYVGGCAAELARLAGLDDDRVLYVGDHVYGDVLRAKKHSPWRTAMILPELERELDAVEITREATRRWDELEQRRQLLLEEAQLGPIDELQLCALEAESSQLEQEIERAFHPYWGPLLKAGSEPSSFGHQVEAYACLYTARVENLSGYSPIHYFRSPRERLPHEV